MHLGPVGDPAVLRMSAHLLLGEGGPQDILGELLPPVLVSAVNAHLVMDASPGVPPAYQLLDQRLIDLSLPSKHREDLVAREQLKFLEIDVGHGSQPAVGRKQAIRDDGMQMRMPIRQIAEGLNRHNHPGDRLRLLQGGLEEHFETGIDVLTECAQEAAILSEIDAEHLGDGEDILAMGNGSKQMLGDPFAKLKDARAIDLGDDFTSYRQCLGRPRER